MTPEQQGSLIALGAVSVMWVLASGIVWALFMLTAIVIRHVMEVWK